MKRQKARDEIARNMGAIRSVGGRTETLLRSILHSLGCRFRKNDPRVLGKPDIIFSNAKVAVFIDGDYWHGRRVREEGEGYLTSYFTADQQSYWIRKMNRNIERDEFVKSQLENEGWTVIRIWESDVKQDPISTAILIVDELRRHMREVR